MSSNYSAEIAEAIRSLLEEDGFSFFFDEEKGMFKFKMRVPRKVSDLVFLIPVESNDYIVYTYCPFGVDHEDKQTMNAMKEFLTDVNFGIKNGNIEFDLNDGEIRYKTFVDCEDQIPGQEVIRESIKSSIRVFGRYGLAMADVCLGRLTPEEAMEKCDPSFQMPLLSIEEFSERLKKDPNDPVVGRFLEMVAAALQSDSEDETEEDGEPVRTDLFDA